MSRMQSRIRKTVFIFTEGESEIAYLQRFKRRGTDYRVEIRKINERDAVTFVKRAYRAAIQSGLSDGDEVYAVFDADIHSKEVLERAVSEARNRNIRLIVSNPCFEVWLLYHYRSGFRYTSSSECEDALTECLGHRYKKSDGIGPVDAETISAAIERSREVFDGEDAIGVKESICGTMLPILVERLLKDE